MQSMSSSCASSPQAVTPPVALDEIFQGLFKMPAAEIRDSMTMQDIALWDSLHHIELIAAIEQKFGFEFTFEEISTMQSIGEIRKLVTAKTGA